MTGLSSSHLLGAAILLVSLAAPGAAQGACSIVLADAQDVFDIRNDLEGDYCLADDIPMSGDFVPPTGTFTGTLDGQGHVISNLTVNASYAGLFSRIGGAGAVRNLGFLNPRITGIARAGALAARITGAARIENVHATGESCAIHAGNYAGGLIGHVYYGEGSVIAQSRSDCPVSTTSFGAGGLVGLIDSNSTGVTITKSHATGRVTGGGSAGGLVGSAANVDIRDSHATGEVSTVGGCENVGGLVGGLSASTIKRSFATGRVIGSEGCVSAAAGGLVGHAGFSGISQSFATGPVSSQGGEAGGLVGAVDQGTTIAQVFATGGVAGGGGDGVGGLIGLLESSEIFPSVVSQAFSAGPVSGTGAFVGGLIGARSGDAIVASSHWDTQTSGHAMSAGGAPRATAQLQGALPAGFKSRVWGITPGVSYPYLKAVDGFKAPLATTVRGSEIFMFLPIGQRDPRQYSGAFTPKDKAAKSAVYAIVARAAGATRDVDELRDAAIDAFWRRGPVWRGPVKQHASLGALSEIAPAQPLGESNAIRPIRRERVVILRGSYDGPGGPREHWMLATSFTVDGAGAVTAVVADDPWTGEQVRIDPATKQVVSPAGFPLTNFTVNGYQVVTLKAPPA